MALGGGIWATQNKTIPGAYINFVSAAKASANLSDRGFVAMPIVLSWGADDAVFTVTVEDLIYNSMKVFGYAYDDAALKPIRDLFKGGAQTVYFYKIMNTGVAASNTFGTAKCKGARGNSLKTVIAVNADDASKMDVSTYMGTTLVDKQTVLPNSDNLADTDWVIWKTNVTLTATAGLTFTTGSDGSAVTSTQYQAALDAFEAYSFNVLGCPTATTAIADLFIAYTKRMRDSVGAKFQCVVYRDAADYEGVINVYNDVTDDTNTASAVYWVSGAQAGCAVNKTVTNRKYDGEYTINGSFKQTVLDANVKLGYFMFHKVGTNLRVLRDINSLTTVTVDKNSDFQSNQTIRVLDQIANDIAILFNTRYLGLVQNDASGRVSFWGDIVAHHQQLETLRAIQEFDPKAVVVTAGVAKNAVVVNDAVQPTNAMEILYMTVKVS